MTYFDYAILCIKKKQYRIERKTAFFPSRRKDAVKSHNYGGITLTNIAANIYDDLLLIRIMKKDEKFLRKKFLGKIVKILEGGRAKTLEATHLFVDYAKAFDSIHWGKLEQIFLAYKLLLRLWCPTKIRKQWFVHPIVTLTFSTGVLQGNTSASFLFIICLDYIQQNSIKLIKENIYSLYKRQERENIQ